MNQRGITQPAQAINVPAIACLVTSSRAEECFVKPMVDTSRRTGVSGLTDAELELLDAVFFRYGSRAVLSAGVFSGQYNRPCHGLSDHALQAVLDRFEKEGWTAGHDYASAWSASDRTVEMTPDGGRIWESERRPEWNRYVMDTGGGWTCTKPTRHRVAIYGFSPNVVRAFFDIGSSCGFFGVSAGPTRTAVASRQFVYWRPAQPVYLLSSWIVSGNTGVDWPSMEERRCWWRFSDEIGKLWGLPPA